MEIFIIFIAIIIACSGFLIGREYSRRKQAEKEGKELKIVGKNLPTSAKAIMLIVSFAFLAFCIYYFVKTAY